MKRLKKSIIIAAMCVALALCLAGCTTTKTVTVNGHTYKTEKSDGHTYEYVDDVLVSIDGSEIGGDDTIEDTEEQTKIQTTEESTTAPAETKISEVKETQGLTSADISDDWTDYEFILDGVKYQLPFAYHDIEAQGWTFDIADYGYSEYLLNPGDKVYSTIDLTNPKYPGDEDGWKAAVITVGFQNNGTSAQNIYDCDIYSVTITNAYGWSKLDSYPDLIVVGGLTWGSTNDEIEAVCGVCEDPYIYESDDFNTYTLSYDENYTSEIEFCTTDEIGLYEVRIANPR